jgi:hypothetical protein
MYVDLEVLNFIERTKTKFKHAKIQISADANLFFLFKEFFFLSNGSHLG